MVSWPLSLSVKRFPRSVILWPITPGTHDHPHLLLNISDKKINITKEARNYAEKQHCRKRIKISREIFITFSVRKTKLTSTDRVGDWGESWMTSYGGNGGGVRWAYPVGTPQDKDYHTFLVGQFSEVKVQTGVLLNDCGPFFFNTELRRHPRRLESTNFIQTTARVRRFSNSRVSISQSNALELVYHWTVLELQSFGRALDTSIAP